MIGISISNAAGSGSGGGGGSVMASIAETVSAQTEALTGTVVDPTIIAGLLTWHRADLGVTDVAGAASVWADQSGNGIDLAQGTAGRRPTIVASAAEANGQAALDFDGTDDQMQGVFTGLNTVAAFTWFLVSRTDVPGTRMAAWATTPGVATGMQQGETGQDEAAWVNLDQGYSAQTATTPHVTTAVYDGTGVGDAGRLKVWRNGSAQTLTYAGGIDAATVGTGLILEVGDVFATAGAVLPWNGRLYELVTYNSVLSTANRELIELYLRTRYAI